MTNFKLITAAVAFTLVSVGKFYVDKEQESSQDNLVKYNGCYFSIGSERFLDLSGCPQECPINGNKTFYENVCVDGLEKSLEGWSTEVFYDKECRPHYGRVIPPSEGIEIGFFEQTLVSEKDILHLSEKFVIDLESMAGVSDIRLLAKSILNTLSSVEFNTTLIGVDNIPSSDPFTISRIETESQIGLIKDLIFRKDIESPVGLISDLDCPPSPVY